MSRKPASVARWQLESAMDHLWNCQYPIAPPHVPAGDLRVDRIPRIGCDMCETYWALLDAEQQEFVATWAAPEGDA